MTWAVAAAVASGLQAVSSIQQGKFQAANLKLQGKQAVLKGRKNALGYSQQAIDALDAQNRMASRITAYGFANGVDAFTGSSMTVDRYNAFKAGKEYNLGLENADMAIAGGLAQSQALNSAAKHTMKMAYLNAAASVAQGVYMYGALSTPTGTGSLGLNTSGANSMSAANQSWASSQGFSMSSSNASWANLGL